MFKKNFKPIFVISAQGISFSLKSFYQIPLTWSQNTTCTTVRQKERARRISLVKGCVKLFFYFSNLMLSARSFVVDLRPVKKSRYDVF